MSDSDTVARLDVWDIVRRTERARSALLASVMNVSDERFVSESAEQWSVARILCHVVWVEHYWALTLEHLLRSPEVVVAVSESENEAIANTASRRSGTPDEQLPVPPPYADRREALEHLDGSQAAFLALIKALRAEHFRKRMISPQGEVSLRFAVEHVIEHDWDHALQIGRSAR